VGEGGGWVDVRRPSEDAGRVDLRREIAPFELLCAEGGRADAGRLCGPSW
jgi:hypothetical protein